MELSKQQIEAGIEAVIINERERSTQQNKSFYKWIEEVASECEAQGVDRKTMVEDLGDANIPITGKFIKEVIWFHYMVAMYGKESTAQLTTKEMTEVEKVVTLHLQENYGLQTKWPSQDDQSFLETYIT